MQAAAAPLAVEARPSVAVLPETTRQAMLLRSSAWRGGWSVPAGLGGVSSRKDDSRRLRWERCAATAPLKPPPPLPA
ncbi:hypothetical protein Esi_0056_0078 [Ectocarpus siliculosus]|uniref:Uncharacterized protein n=1 Tax=Ectocarpus siliculosus TaxID=2880 RepID=D8LPZ4_ECTSI|nr:hypothetical protein Esi_0056_0078 [Ectocarpus siliculosus]|eukprot:CBN74886.1 hypothetical protein Esi_0056_0078 [Ectocarpus siliculosus]